jgi:hypothetical protein
MHRAVVLFASVVFAAGLAVSADAAAPCKDAKGKFIKCPVPAASTAPKQCRDKTTKKFAKCSAPNTEALPAKK